VWTVIGVADLSAFPSARPSIATVPLQLHSLSVVSDSAIVSYPPVRLMHGSTTLLVGGGTTHARSLAVDQASDRPAILRRKKRLRSVSFLGLRLIVPLDEVTHPTTHDMRHDN
jgi:hypothetical protein